MANLWQRLKSVLDTDPLRLGTIAVVNANNTVACTMANGGTLVVRGTGTVGAQVWIQSGEVRSTASGLTVIGDQDV
jgi:hypothetical protein